MRTRSLDDSGVDANQRATRNDVASYNAASDRWQRWSPMPTPRHGLAAVTIDASIYVIGGGPKPGPSFSAANEMFRP